MTKIALSGDLRVASVRPCTRLAIRPDGPIGQPAGLQLAGSLEIALCSPDHRGGARYDTILLSPFLLV